MSINASDLSNPKYGYDFVIATTQASINATMNQYIYALSAPEVIMCYVMDQQGIPQQIDYQTLVSKANGTDPFQVPSGISLSSQEVQNLSNASFLYAFKAQIGIPPGYAPLTPGGPVLPDVVVLGAETSEVSYNLMSSEFTVVEATYGPRGIMSWLNASQPDGAAWIFTSKVDLILTANNDYGKLPAQVQQQIKNLKNTPFSVQQLLFDLDNAALETLPTISGLAPGTQLCTCLETVFVNEYFSVLQQKGQQVLSYTISMDPSASTLALTDFNMEVCPYLNPDGSSILNPTQQQQDLATLCYLCASNNPLPAVTPFNWNWIDASEENSYSGAIAINRNTIAQYLKNTILPYITPNCNLIDVRVYLSGPLDGTCNYYGSFAPGQTPTVTFPTTGPTVLEFSYESKSVDEAGLDGDIGQMELKTNYDVLVTMTGNTITVQQHLVLYLWVQAYQSSDGANIYDKTITDTITISVNENGQLTCSPTSTTVDNSQTITVGWFTNLFTGLGDIVDNFQDWGSKFYSLTFMEIPVCFITDFYFPGGNTFTYNDVCFTENQDLVSHITYLQPNS
jgi:hypothetical protein